MNRIIVDNHCKNISDMDALSLVAEVIKEGRVSDNGESYCSVTTWKYPESKNLKDKMENKNGTVFDRR